MNDEALEECIRECWNCRNSVQKTLFRHCLPIGGIHMEELHVKLMVDCMEICQSAADFMTRNSAYHEDVCQACAVICDACANACEKIGDEAMMKCAKACRQCAESCRQMSNMKKAA